MIWLPTVPPSAQCREWKMARSPVPYGVQAVERYARVRAVPCYRAVRVREARSPPHPAKKLPAGNSRESARASAQYAAFRWPQTQTIAKIAASSVSVLSAWVMGEGRVSVEKQTVSGQCNQAVTPGRYGCRTRHRVCCWCCVTASSGEMLLQVSQRVAARQRAATACRAGSVRNGSRCGVSVSARDSQVERPPARL